jgi:pyruvate dehydrogenase E1 component alpha subunit
LAQAKKKTAAKKAVAKKTATKSTKKSVVKKPAAKKVAAKSNKKSAVKKPAAKKATAKVRKAPRTVAKKGAVNRGPSNATLKAMHLKMLRIRRFEESAGKLMEDGKIPGALHLYVGQEAVASGVMQHLSNEDWITSTHRGHGHLVAKGGEFKPMFAELFGRSTGYCNGKGGSMHISNMDLGMLGANGIVGGGPPIAMGAAFSNQFKGNKNVSIAFFGDGASNEGSVHEAANMAALYKLPCVFVCENNGYGEYTPQSGHQAIVDVADRASGYGMPGVICDGMDVMSVYEAAGEAIERARSGGGPTLLECKTYRYYDHVGVRGMGLNYRTDEEVEAWKKKDAINAFEKRLIQLGVMSKKQIDVVHAAVDKDIEEAVKYANDSPYPTEDQLLENVYYVKGA